MVKENIRNMLLDVINNYNKKNGELDIYFILVDMILKEFGINDLRLDDSILSSELKNKISEQADLFAINFYWILNNNENEKNIVDKISKEESDLIDKICSVIKEGRTELQSLNEQKSIPQDELSLKEKIGNVEQQNNFYVPNLYEENSIEHK